jgi:hypothetical protein
MGWPGSGLAKDLSNNTGKIRKFTTKNRRPRACFTRQGYGGAACGRGLGLAILWLQAQDRTRNCSVSAKFVVKFHKINS